METTAGMSCGRFLQTEQLSFQGEAGRLLKRAKTLYQKRKMEFDETTINANHTYVSETLRGQGVADKLYQALVAFIQENQLKLVPSCSYIAKKWQRDNP